MSIFSRKSDPTQTAEADVAQLEKRRGALGAKLASAQSALEAARAARREHLIESTEDDASATAKFEGAVATAERDVVALHDAIGELDARLADARKRLVGAKETAVREAQAAQREDAAKKVEEISAKLDGAVDAVDRLFDELVAVIPQGAAQIYEPGHGPRPATPYEAARQIVAEGLHKAGDGLFELVGKRAIGATIDVKLPLRYLRRDGVLDAGIPKNDDSVSFLHASGAAERIIVAPLRKVASEIRAGRVAVDAMRPAPRKAPVEPPTFPTQRVVFLKPATYLAVDGRKIVEDGSWEASVAEPVATRAIELGLAVSTDDPRAIEHLRKKNRRPEVDMRRQEHLQPEEPVDLGVDLKKLKDAERERLNQRLEAAE